MKQTKEYNRQILLNARPHGAPCPSDFRLEQTDIPKPGKGEVLLRTLYLSLDPYMRGRMSKGPSYAPPVALNDLMVGGKVFDGALPLLNTKARVPLCGLIAHYNDTKRPAGPDRLSLLHAKCA